MHRHLAPAGCFALVLAVILATYVWPAGAAPLATTPQYTVTDLGTLGGADSNALDINAAGRIVGTALTAANIRHSFLYSNGVMNDIGTLGGNFGIASAINTGGQITGQADTVDGKRHGFLYDNGVTTDIGTLGGLTSRASDINAAGQIVGSSSLLGDAVSHAFLYSGGVMTDLGALPGDTNSFANSINTSGQIAGAATPGGGLVQAHAFLYNNGAMADLGSLGGSRSVAYQLNDAGQVVGWSDLAGDGSSHAFLYSNGVMTDLGSLGGSSQASGINAVGTIVGWTNVPGDTSIHAFVYRCGTMQDLNDLVPADSSLKLVYAAAINDAGNIVGWGTINGHTHAFLLTLRSPAELLGDLIRLVQGYNQRPGIENSLIVKLQHAQDAFAGGDPVGGVSTLETFINEVNAQAGKALTSDQADQLIAEANQILLTLGCP